MEKTYIYRPWCKYTSSLMQQGAQRWGKELVIFIPPWIEKRYNNLLLENVELQSLLLY